MRNNGAMRAASLLLLFLLGVAAARAGATLDRVTRTGTVTNVLIDTYPPFAFIDADNRLAGFDVDVARAFAAKLGAKLVLDTPSWDTIVTGHWHGRWDICICSMTPTDERAKVLDFPVQYYSSPAVLVVHRDETHIRSVADLSGKRVGVGLGSSYENYLNHSLVIRGAAPPPYPFQGVIAIPGDETVNFRNLALGPGVRLDAIIASLSSAKAAAASLPALKIVGPILFAEPNAVATERGDPEWDATVVRVFAALRADGTLARISQRWLGTDVTADAR
jgi:polar amino acid transport system substrate-binding protein